MTTSTKKATDKTPTTDTTARACVVPNLQRVRVAYARRLLGPLGCKAGKVRHLHSRKVAKGAVIRTTPKRGTYAAGRRVGLIVSSGPLRHRPHRQT
jgi:beta-lactam-binding protein with PASTA domain